LGAIWGRERDGGIERARDGKGMKGGEKKGEGGELLNSGEFSLLALGDISPGFLSPFFSN